MNCTKDVFAGIGKPAGSRRTLPDNAHVPFMVNVRRVCVGERKYLGTSRPCCRGFKESQTDISEREGMNWIESFANALGVGVLAATAATQLFEYWRRQDAAAQQVRFLFGVCYMYCAFVELVICVVTPTCLLYRAPGACVKRWWTGKVAGLGGCG